MFKNIQLLLRKPKRIDASYTSDWREENWFDIAGESENNDTPKIQSLLRNRKRNKISNLQNQGKSLNKLSN